MFLYTKKTYVQRLLEKMAKGLTELDEVAGDGWRRHERPGMARLLTLKEFIMLGWAFCSFR